MKLYECPRHSYIKIDYDSTGTIYFFENLDGMYSFCRDQYGNIVYLAAYINIVVVDKPENWGELNE